MRGRERARHLAELLIQARVHLTFSLFSRADNIDHDTFCLLARAGLRTVWLGVESFSEEFLRRFNKRISLETVFAAINLLRLLGIRVKIGLIMFHPYSSLEEIRTNFVHLRRIWEGDRHAVSFRHLLSRLRLYDSTPIADALERDGLIVPNHLLSGYAGYRMEEAVQAFYDAVTAMYRDCFSPQVAFLDRVASARHRAPDLTAEAIELKADLFYSFADWYDRLLDRSLRHGPGAGLVADGPGLAATVGHIEGLRRRVPGGECPELRHHLFVHMPYVYDTVESRFIPRMVGDHPALPRAADPGKAQGSMRGRSHVEPSVRAPPPQALYPPRERGGYRAALE